MNKLALSILVVGLGLMAAPVKSEPGEHHDHAKMIEKSKENQQKRLAKWTKELKLTADQQTTVKAAWEEKQTKMMDLHKEFSDKRKVITDEADAKITAVLSAEQKASYEKLKEEKFNRKEYRKDKKK